MTAFVREVAGPPGATAVLLLHGLTAVADLNWFGVFEALGRESRVVSAEQRGPARSAEGWPTTRGAGRRPRIDRFVVAGYSMGGAVAQLGGGGTRPGSSAVLMRHRRPVRRHPCRADRGRLPPAASPMARLAPSLGRRLVGQTLITRCRRPPMAGLGRSPSCARRPPGLPMLITPLRLARLSSEPWLGEVDVPTVVVVADRRPTRPADASCSWPGPSRGRRCSVAADHGVFGPARTPSTPPCSTRAGEASAASGARMAAAASTTAAA